MHKFQNAYQKENRTALILPVAVAFIIPALIGLFQPRLINYFFMLILIIIFCVLPGYVIFKTIFAWINGDSFFRTLLTCLKPLPAGLPIGSDLKNKVWPYMTILLIVVNTLLFFIVSEDLKNLMVFPPRRNSPLLLYPVGFFMHAFMHAYLSHLFGNMVFLWVFGNTLETRIGHFRFLAIYFACIAGAAIFYCLMSTIAGSHRSGLGASGAISGIMGVFAVRCYFARVTVGLPFLFLPVVSVPLRVQALALICLFFAMDAAGSRATLLGESTSNVGYWAHVGGYLLGFFVAYFFGFHHQAAEESVNVKADRLGKSDFGKKEAADIYRDILEKNPDDVDALMFFLNHYKHSPKQARIFSKLMDVLASKDTKNAVAVFNDFYPKYLNMLSGRSALILGSYFYKNLDLEKARNCLEMASDKPGPWQPKALLLLGRVFEDMGNKNLARKIYDELKEEFPDTLFAREAHINS